MHLLHPATAIVRQGANARKGNERAVGKGKGIGGDGVERPIRCKGNGPGHVTGENAPRGAGLRLSSCSLLAVHPTWVFCCWQRNGMLYGSLWLVAYRVGIHGVHRTLQDSQRAHTRWTA